MNYKKMMMICAATVFCMILPAQPVCAQEQTEIGQTDMEDTPADEEFTDTSLTEENQENASSPEEAPVEEPVQKPLTPEKVTGLHVTCVTDQKVLLEWNKSEEADYYSIYRNEEGGTFQKLGDTKKDCFRDTSVVFGKTYEYMVVPYNEEDQEGKEATIRLVNKQAVNIRTQKYTYHQMQTDLRELAKKYSDYCELTSIGTSVEGRNIYDFAIGAKDAEESLLVVSTLHAREYICSAMLMQELEYYLRNYNHSLRGSTPAKVLEHMQIHYIVMANPDGVTMAQNQYPRWKANGRGVDLNNNFPAKKFVVSGKPGASGYTGKKALSEPESKAIAALTKELKKNRKLLGVVNYHAMGQIVFGDCADVKLKKDTQKMYQIARRLTGYYDAGGYSSGKSSPAGGSYREYVMDLLKLPSITIEVGKTYAPCAYSEYASAFRKNKLVVLKIAEAL